MKTKGILVVLAALTICFTGCAGTRFTRVATEDAKIGTDTLESVRANLGKPYMESTIIKNGKTVKALTYSFAKASLGIYAGKPTPARTQAFYFHDNILVGHNYISSQKNDGTSFDSSKIEQIKENGTKINEVISLLGPPAGEYVYPLVEKENEKALVYSYVQVRMGFAKMKIYQQILTISYDPASSIVKKLEFVETGEK